MHTEEHRGPTDRLTRPCSCVGHGSSRSPKERTSTGLQHTASRKTAQITQTADEALRIASHAPEKAMHIWPVSQSVRPKEACFSVLTLTSRSVTCVQGWTSNRHYVYDCTNAGSDLLDYAPGAHVRHKMVNYIMPRWCGRSFKVTRTQGPYLGLHSHVKFCILSISTI
jgi:hypothetical protein